MTQEVSEYRAVREEKRDALTVLGVNPYEVRTPERTPNAVIRTEFETAEKAATEDNPAALKDCAIAGRVLANRKTCGLAFDLVADERVNGASEDRR